MRSLLPGQSWAGMQACLDTTLAMGPRGQLMADNGLNVVESDGASWHAFLMVVPAYAVAD